MSGISRTERLGVRTWIEIDRAALEHNYKTFRELIPKPTKLLSVVKSNAYGHGLVDFSKQLETLGVDWFAVDSIVEGLKLRKEGITKPILVLGYTLPELLQEAINQDITVTASSMYMLTDISTRELKGILKIHVKIDSGMHRQGFMSHEMEEVLKVLTQNNHKISVDGLYTHFASAKDPAFTEETQKQRQLFLTWVDAFKGAGFSPIVHAAATGAALLFPDTHFDMVRIGIGMHGIWPSPEIGLLKENSSALKTTLSWKTIVSEIKLIPAGEKIGYDFTEETTRETKIAVCPIGYWHGFPRSLSSVGHVLVNGSKAKVMGRVSMDMIVIDVTDTPDLNVGDEVVLIGKSGDLEITATDVANTAGYSRYEFITRINPLIKKIYI
ncbi:MAG: alanine racemase [Patescibacteria group bacterium]